MRTFLACALIVMCVAPVRSQAIELHPSAQQVATALERGQTAATARTPPVELYSWFGPPRDDANEFRPRGFLMTKLSEEHTSELQSLAYLVCRLLLEKKKKKHDNTAFD